MGWVGIPCSFEVPEGGAVLCSQNENNAKEQKGLGFAALIQVSIRFYLVVKRNMRCCAKSASVYLNLGAFESAYLLQS